MTAGYQVKRTDPLGWRLKVSEQSHGQHKWVYLPPGQVREEWPQDLASKYWSGMPLVSLLITLSRRLWL